QGGSVTTGCAAGGTDLNGDGDAADLVIEAFDLATGAVTVVGTPAVGTGDPLQGGEQTTLGGVGTTYVSRGRCLAALTVRASCPINADRGPAASCTGAVCQKDQGVCTTDVDCPPGITCAAAATVPASADRDGDGVPDHLDNCPDTANGDQIDTD